MINIRSSVQTSLTGKESIGSHQQKVQVKGGFYVPFSQASCFIFLLVFLLCSPCLSISPELDVSVSKMAAISNQGCMCLLHIQESEFSVSHNHQANVLKCSLTGSSWSFGQDLRNPACLSLMSHIKSSGEHSDILCPNNLWEDGFLPTSLSLPCCTL